MFRCFGIIRLEMLLRTEPDTTDRIVVAHGSKPCESMRTLDDTTMGQLIGNELLDFLVGSDSPIIVESLVLDDFKDVWSFLALPKDLDVAPCHTHNMEVDVSIRNVLVIVGSERMADDETARYAMLHGDVHGLITLLDIGLTLDIRERNHSMDYPTVVLAIV